ncbi:MAG: glycosyltransferase [Actinobacteria bacterium HGW-Actinobacteria-7]|jgi:dolichol-phosphate mannosyltransferase|nr:MAG: glycosyltransferase [Actinobacteria bacterium HGW-Actinobacteria-7]
MSSTPADRKLVSIVVPAYNEEGNIEELARRLRIVFDNEPSYDFEVILVENGSADLTWQKISDVCASDPRFKSVRLSRNFQTDGGLTAGVSFASGDAAVFMCADLQDPPELIHEFLVKWAAGYENVYQVITRRVGTSALRRFNSQAFYWLINKLTGGTFPRNASDFRLIDRRVYSTINEMGEHNRFLRGMVFWTGFASIGVEHERPERFAGDSKAGTLRMIELAVRSILSYSNVPLRLITWTGLAVSAFSFVLLLWEVYKAVAHGVPFAGFGTIMGVMLLMFGFLFTMLGVVAEYIGLIYEEVKERPNFVVREKIGL